jgi:energy-coupling factor transporter ATP-binding protein EcfA2
MKPEYLILDEPTAGLDPEGRKEMLDIIDVLHAEAGMTIIMVTHDAESVAKRADRVIAMDRGTIVSDGSPAEAFVDVYEKNTHSKVETDEKSGRNDETYAGDDIDYDMVGLPVALKLIARLSSLGMEIPYYTVDMDECVELIKNALV